MSYTCNSSSPFVKVSKKCQKSVTKDFETFPRGNGSVRLAPKPPIHWYQPNINIILWRIGRGDKKTFFAGIQDVSAWRVRKELVNHYLYLFACPLRVGYGWPFVVCCKIQDIYIYIFSLNKIYLCSRYYFTTSRNTIYSTSRK